jgi:hypothetical protein
MTPEQHAYIFQRSKEPEYADVTGVWDEPQHVAIIRTAAEHKFIFGHVPSPGFPPAGKVLLVPVVVVHKTRAVGATVGDLDSVAQWGGSSSDPVADIKARIATEEARALAPKPRTVTEEELARARQ